MAKRLFVTGTDTDVGKTHMGCALLSHLGRLGLKAAGLKPIASGGRIDAERLWRHSSLQLPLDSHNPFHFAPPIAPHLAAAEAGVALGVDEVLKRLEPWQRQEADWLLMEGAGGWRVPLNDNETFADLAKAWGGPVVLVVGMRLGCVNHALLTAEAIRSDGLELLGWVANRGLGEMDRLEDNLAYLKRHMGAPLLALAGQSPEPAAIEVDWKGC
ncbi:dethiobiotin synthase [Gallaecimonas kandeliae]|uniref:dethiobiotin synthase n=1 Tax=Gallaecimonas kandeliae TaxID=3029055 RepID=UPI0026490ED3|nr:dethiobiotin synthase [Gallaecimonas kandeliae]WKE67409.1 dethiobiotin synthase [Gallaecimonas kandeliae]